MSSRDEDIISFPVEKLDHVNYFGLAQGKQVIVCMRRKVNNDIILWPKENPYPEKHELSEEGEECLSYLQKYPLPSNTSYIAKVDLFDVKDNDLTMWEKLYKEGLFPYWKSASGPYKFHDKKHGQVAFCRVEEIELTIRENSIIDIELTHAKIEEKETIAKINILKRRPVLFDAEYNRQLEKIIDIMGKNITPLDWRGI